jgi:hypothetical protein
LEYCIWIGEGAASMAGPRAVSSHHAPRFEGDPHGRQNIHCASASDWGAFCRATELHELFFAPSDGLMAILPGATKLTREHARTIHAALERFLIANGRTAPSFVGASAESHLARLLWLDWWVHWALRSCTDPAIHCE